MRDPRGPIPSPHHQGARAAAFWEKPAPPPLVRDDAAEEGTGVNEYDPTRLLHGSHADAAGIDRRTRPRDGGSSHTVHGIAATQHKRLDAVLALSATSGWVLVRTLSLAPNGVLLHLLDLLDPDLEPFERTHGRAMLLRLAPVLGAPLRPRHLEAAASGHPSETGGSMLATVGQCVLARRLIADLSCWSSRTQGLRSSRAAPTSPLAVSLLVPGRARSGPRTGRAGLTTIPGELLPLTDPKPQVLAVGLVNAAAAQLELALRHQIDPKRGPSPTRGRTPTQP
jgi:hypothetical protein